MKSFDVKGLHIGEGLPKICVPLTAKDKDALAEEARAAEAADCDLVEWRVDHYVFYLDERLNALKELTLPAEGMRIIRENTAKPVLMTLRTEEEGGMLDLIRRDYYTIIRDIVNEEAARPDMLDIEAFDTDDENGFDRVEFLVHLAQEEGIKVVLSNHDFDKTPPVEEIVKRICTMDKLDADLPKAAYMPQTEEDVYKVIEAARVTVEYCDKPFIALSMGDAGLPTRICSGQSGTAVTFATVGQASAPGQIEAARMRQMLAEYYK